MILLEDVYSNFHSRKVYGLKGDKVKLISDRDPVLIVEGKKGSRLINQKLKKYK